MNVRDALRLMAEGHKVGRPGGWVLELQPATVPILTQEIVTGYSSDVINDNWLFCKFPLIASSPASEDAGTVGAPYAFTPDDMNATDWERIE